MNRLSGNRWRFSWPWLILGAVSALVLAVRLQISFDLSAFFPRSVSLTHDVLLEQYRNGPGSRLLVVGISGASRGELEALSAEIRNELQKDSQFENVLNGVTAIDDVAIPEPVASYYLLMRDIDLGATSLDRAIRDRLGDIALGGGDALLDLIARDPFLLTLDVLQNLTPVNMSGDTWFAANGSAVLVAETRANAVDIQGQKDAVNAVRAAFEAAAAGSHARLDITGVGAFGVELQSSIRAEATKRSVLASLALLIILFGFYRSFLYLALAALPIVMGLLTGLAVVCTLFDSVHGITLAFGFTLMGIAVDYPLHLFSHSKVTGSGAPMQRIWPTMRLGALSTATAYLALTLSGSQGLAQLGIFTATGIAVAVLVTRTWLPCLIGGKTEYQTVKHGASSMPRLGFAPALMVLTVVLLTLGAHRNRALWDDNLSSLSPVPAERLQADRDLRGATGAPDMRYQIVLHDASIESLLQKNEFIDSKLAEAASGGTLGGWQSVTRVLPSVRTQAARQKQLPTGEVLRQRVRNVVKASPFNDSAFDAFAENVILAKSLPPLRIRDFSRSPLASWLDAHVLKVRDVWVSLISLNDPDPGKLAVLIPQWAHGATLIDLRQASLDLMRDYRHGVLKTVSGAAFLILLLLWYQRGKISHLLWNGLTVSASVCATAVLVVSLHGQLTVIHLIALLLVMGLGLDYALFLSRSETAEQQRATRHAVLACATSTSVAFSILACSSIPVLRFLGATVAAGSAISFLLARAGSRSQVPASSSSPG